MTGVGKSTMPTQDLCQTPGLVGVTGRMAIRLLGWQTGLILYHYFYGTDGASSLVVCQAPILCWLLHSTYLVPERPPWRPHDLSLSPTHWFHPHWCLTRALALCTTTQIGQPARPVLPAPPHARLLLGLEKQVWRAGVSNHRALALRPTTRDCFFEFGSMESKVLPAVDGRPWPGCRTKACIRDCRGIASGLPGVIQARIAAPEATRPCCR